jgi:hypothetical protein
MTNDAPVDPRREDTAALLAEGTPQKSLEQLHHEIDELGERIEHVRHDYDSHHRHGPTFAEGWGSSAD